MGFNKSKITEDQFRETIKNCLSIHHASKTLKMGSITCRKYIDKYNIDISHFTPHGLSEKYKAKISVRVCPICGTHFQARDFEKKVTCSKACSNKYFPRREEISNYYTKLCFRHHKKECVVCKESRIVSVHHYDGNHDNDTIENLIPLCPTCHLCLHSKAYKEQIRPIVDVYRNEFIKSNKLLQSRISYG